MTSYCGLVTTQRPQCVGSAPHDKWTSIQNADRPNQGIRIWECWIMMLLWDVPGDLHK